ncbi:MAG: futalosine hydrolase [Bacteroidetes bacterium]|nr:futalosine hydrolase [Bacteroidota bacterium]
MKLPQILIISATEFEIAPFLKKHHIAVSKKMKLYKSAKIKNLSILITGVGMVNTAFAMGVYCKNNYDLIINAGIAGSFNKKNTLGAVHNITKDCISELGAEDGESFISFDKLQLGGTQHFKNKLKKYAKFFKIYPTASAITVNTVHGNEKTIANVKQQYQPELESMEGAAFFMAAAFFNTEYTQLRSISNYVEKRDKSKWRIKLAIKNLNKELNTIIKTIYNEVP